MARKKPTFAVIQFPGSNCELEMAAAIECNGMQAEHFRWNEKKSLAKFDGVAIVGGFSYEDRGRSGLVASRDQLLAKIAKFAENPKKIVLGVCNGAQILVESGLVPSGQFGKSVVALTDNRRTDGEGFYNRWVEIAPGSEILNAFNSAVETPLRIPIAHAEGRFACEDPQVLTQIVERGQNAFVYTDGNPNGSVLDLAGLTNPAGNALALMPHPERTPAGDPIFQSMRNWLAGAVKKPAAKKLSGTESKITIETKPQFATEIFVKLIITDNEAWTLGQSAGLALEKYRWFSLPKMSAAEIEKLIRSGRLANAEKEEIFVKANGKTFQFDKNRGLVATKFSLPKNRVLARARDEADRGVVWTSTDTPAKFERAAKQKFFHHPAASQLTKI